MTPDSRPAAAGSPAHPAAYAPRYIGFTTPHELYCPRGHHMKQDSVVLDDGVLWCKHRDPLPGGKGGGPECGKLVYVCLGWQPRGSSVPLEDSPLDLPASACLFVAEVTFKEAREMQRLRLDLAAVLRFLGVRFPVAALVPAV